MRLGDCNRVPWCYTNMYVDKTMVYVAHKTLKLSLHFSIGLTTSMVCNISKSVQLSFKCNRV